MLPALVGSWLRTWVSPCSIGRAYTLSRHGTEEAFQGARARLPLGVPLPSKQDIPFPPLLLDPVLEWSCADLRVFVKWHHRPLQGRKKAVKFLPNFALELFFLNPVLS